MRVQHLLGTDICEAVFSSAGSPRDKCCYAAGRCAGCSPCSLRSAILVAVGKAVIGTVRFSPRWQTVGSVRANEESSGEAVVSADPLCKCHSSEGSTWGRFRKPSARLGLESSRCIWSTPSRSVSPGKIQLASVKTAVFLLPFLQVSSSVLHDAEYGQKLSLCSHLKYNNRH